MNKILLIFGGHSTGCEILDLVKDYFPNRFAKCFNVVEDQYKGKIINTILDKDLPLFISKNKDQISYIISMGSQRLRYKFIQFSNKHNLNPITLIHPSAVIAENALIGNGVYIAANVSVSSYVDIQNHVIINYNAIIGHNSKLHDNVIINPGAVIGGNVRLKERVLIGANSFILQGKQIESDCSIDALTYVDSDLNKRTIASGQKMKTFP